MYLSIVIPAYNEGGSIDHTLRSVAGHLQTCDFQAELIVVDDGSTDRTAEAVRNFAAVHPWVHLIQQEQNHGKGASVRRGVLAARGEYIFFMDADLSVPITELDAALDVIARGACSVVIGSRRAHGAHIEKRQPLVRQYLGQAFTYLTRALLCPAILDFTCGFKGFRRREAQMLFSSVRCNDWAFDAEILYLARLLHIPVHQHPVRWSHHRDSKVRFPRDIWRTLSALIRIRLRGAVKVHLPQVETS